MKNLFLLVLVVCVGCSSVGEYPRLFIAEDSGTDTSTDEEDAGSDSSVDADSDSDTDSEVDAGSDAGTGIPCDAGACCVDGEVAFEGTPCISDVVPENAAEEFNPALDVPLQFRCPNPDVCGGGEERRVGQTVCDGLNPTCSLDSILWGSWEVTFETSPNPNSVCDPMRTDGVVIWSNSTWVGASFYGCSSGCFEGQCLPAFSGDECAFNVSDFFCGSCDNNCFENGGSQCGGGAGEIFCQCGLNPACDEGNRCLFDWVTFDYSCVPE
jgi:hypothetical protein